MDIKIANLCAGAFEIVVKTCNILDYYHAI